MIQTRGRLPASLMLAGLAGATVALQARSNGELGAELRDPYIASMVSCTVGVLVLLMAVLRNAKHRAALRDTLTLLSRRSCPVWLLTGGLSGAFLVVAQSAAIGVLGVALFSVGTVAGQATMGIVLDRVGLGVASPIRLNVMRLVGAALAIVAVLVAGFEAQGEGALSWMLLLPLIAGIGAGWQAAVNGELRRTTGNALVATLVNFSVGWIALFAVCVVSLLIMGWPANWPSHWWPYAGGLLGVAYIGLSVMLVRTTGVLLLGLAIVAGQLVCAFALDVFMPLGPAPDLSTLAGALLALIAVVIAASSRRIVV